MANSKYDYVKQYEQNPTILPDLYFVIRIDGRGFHQFSKKHQFQKPNDRRALNLMNAAARSVMKEMQDIRIGYGISDEFSFVFDQSCRLFQRRKDKILTTVVSTFSAYYISLWPSFFPSINLTPPLPSFDGRLVEYPRLDRIQDYLRWRQVDCHINNLYNTTFWALVDKGGMSTTEAEERLKGTVAGDKNEILFKQFGINYNNEEEMYRKGSVLYRLYKEESNSVGEKPAQTKTVGLDESMSRTQQDKERKRTAKAEIVIEHVDIIGDAFWDKSPPLLSS